MRERDDAGSDWILLTICVAGAFGFLVVWGYAAVQAWRFRPVPERPPPP